MFNEIEIEQHYRCDDLLVAIEAALPKIGRSIENVTMDDLSPVDEFHIGGRMATEHLMAQLNISASDHYLDVGCGLGGASRYVANKYKNRVTGIDLTEEYINTGNTLCNWLGLDDQVELSHANALKMPFTNGIFDGAYMLHVGMNIDDKEQLFREVARVLKSGASFGVYDVMLSGDGELKYPVPWATEKSASHLASSSHYSRALENSGFKVSIEKNRRDFAINFFKELKSKTEKNVGLLPLGLHFLMQETTGVKIHNMIDNIIEGYISPVELIAEKI